ncbi:MAG TPA: EAL domain-containing protein [Acidimicrobiales bacterium]
MDDEQGIRDVVRRALEREAFEVLEAVDGQGAIAIADRFELALVILDLELPEMSGLDLLVALRARQPDLHVIILTGSGGEADRVTGLLAGADDYMVKPFSARELAARAVAVRRRRGGVAGSERRALRGPVTVERMASSDRGTSAAEASNEATVVLVGNEVVHANRPAATLVGAEEPDELIGRDLYDFVAPQSFRIATSRQESVKEGRWPRPDVMAIVRLDGEEVLIEVSSMPVTWEGQVASQITMWDLRGDTSKLREVATGIRTDVSDAVLVTDENLLIQSVNPAAEQLYGWSEQELIGRHGAEALPAELVGEVPNEAEPLDSVLSRRGRWHGELRQTCRDGSQVHVQSSVTLLRDGKGDNVGMVIVNRPVVEGRSGAGRRASDGSFDRTLDAEIRRGIERREFEVHYQPVVQLADGTWQGTEALVRWNHPERGLLPPAAFIDTAERSGAIIELGRLVLEDACRQWRSWYDAGAVLQIAVNLSGRQLADADLPVLLERTMRAVGMPPGVLSLEVTETSLVEDIDLASEVLKRAADIGATIAIDDFGTGWASLTYLRQFPVHALKVDRSFVAGLGSESADEAIVASILSLGSELGLTVVAEGIETADQAAHLQRLGCSLGQGFLFSRPLPADQLTPSFS